MNNTRFDIFRLNVTHTHVKSLSNPDKEFLIMQ